MTPGDRDDDPVRAAGGLVLRPAADGAGTEIALVHRPKYDDWTFPKGKLNRGETDEQAAVREVAEETGLDARLDRELPSVRYLDASGRDKVVRYWAMHPEGGEFEPNPEVDQLRWVPVDEAAKLLTYEHDLDLLSSLGQG